ncbi:MAG: hypothetical protein GF331_07340 [Chitinivibrionales bacterium]|nr:hypothetical protein [Chitinivibrionales bacterium]
MRKRALAWLVVMFCAGMSAAQNPAEAQLDSYVRHYIDGEFAQAAEGIVGLFPFLTDPRQQLRAYKYLAYSYAMLGMTQRAHAVFSSALENYPDITIDTLEAPPRVGTIFFDAKIAKQKEWRRRYQQALVDRTVRKASAVLLLTGAGGAAWASGYLLRDAQDGEALSTWTGLGLGMVSLAMLPVSVYLFVKSDNDGAARYVDLQQTPGGPAIVLRF